MCLQFSNKSPACFKSLPHTQKSYRYMLKKKNPTDTVMLLSPRIEGGGRIPPHSYTLQFNGSGFHPQLLLYFYVCVFKPSLRMGPIDEQGKSISMNLLPAPFPANNSKYRWRYHICNYQQPMSSHTFLGCNA